MENLIMKGDFKRPAVAFDASKGLLELNGNSIPERAEDFYIPLLEWIKNYMQNPCEATTLNLKLIYINSRSKRFLLDLLEMMKFDNNNVTINWYYEEDDEDMLDVGETYQELIDFPINFIPMRAND